jgi:hypothetical protein
MYLNSFEEALTGGHPNSLGNTVAVVEEVLADRARLRELFDCYKSTDAVVRLRVSSALKRVTKEHPEWVVPYIDHLLTDVSLINQPSTQWTLAQLFLLLDADFTASQKQQAVAIVKHNLVHVDDWIVQNTSIETLGCWARTDNALRSWLLPQLSTLSGSSRKSVASRAIKMAAILGK